MKLLSLGFNFIRFRIDKGLRRVRGIGFFGLMLVFCFGLRVSIESVWMG